MTRGFVTYILCFRPLVCADTVAQAGALATLVFQNSALAMVMRYTRSSGAAHELYIPATAVLMAEVFKFVVAVAMQRKVCGAPDAVAELEVCAAGHLHRPSSVSPTFTSCCLMHYRCTTDVEVVFLRPKLAI